MSEPAAIELSGIGVRFRIPTQRILSFKEYVLSRLTGGIEYRELWAVQEVGFAVRRGEAFGVVGRNGAGKSTLLGLAAGVLAPSRGSVRVNGRVVPLLELGSGFHPELTGRENILLNGVLLGLTRAQVREKLPEIVDFSELTVSLDQPIRTYSMGMVARLAFSVAAHVRPEILLIDEVLSVGDEMFQRKCVDRMRGLLASPATIVLVSHALDQLADFCTRAVWIEEGEVREVGAAKEVVEAYRSACAGGAPGPAGRATAAKQ